MPCLCGQTLISLIASSQAKDPPSVSGKADEDVRGTGKQTCHLEIVFVASPGRSTAASSRGSVKSAVGDPAMVHRAMAHCAMALVGDRPTAGGEGRENLMKVTIIFNREQ